MKDHPGYYTYLTLHLLETHTDLLNDLTCDERWTEASAHYELWECSTYNDYGNSHYECIERYVQALNLNQKNKSNNNES